MGNKRNKEFLIKEDGTIVRSVISSSKIEIFKKKITRKYEDELHKFFPVAGITLDETTVEEVEAQENMYDRIDYEDDGRVIVWYEDIQIIKDSVCDSFSDVYMIYDDSMFKKWKDIGFSWDLSYTEWKNLFQNMGYDVRIKEKPRKIFYKERGYWYLNAKIVAIAQDHSISFQLHFSYGENGYDVFSKKTLFSIECYGKELTKRYFSYIWGSRHDLECPECGSDDVEDDGSNCVQYRCNDCGYIWGDEEDDVNDEEEDEEDEEENKNEMFCPECGSDDITDDGSNYLQYECNDCGHIWGDDDDE